MSGATIAARPQRPLVVGVGNPDRGDDGVGRVVAARVAELLEARPTCDVRVVEHEDPTSLVDLWTDHDPVVVVDAVQSGATPGTIHRLEVGTDSDPLPAGTWASAGRGGSHAFGVATAVELARALRRLPRHLTLVGVEAGSVEYGAPLSPRVVAAVDVAAEEVANHVSR